MKVDKTRFLLLTGALAAATVVGVGTTSGCTTTSTSTDGGTTGDSGPGTDSGGDDGSTGDSGACLGDTASTPAPDAEGGGGIDCSANGCDLQCASASANFRAGVAEEIQKCLLKLSACEDNAAGINGCIEDAVGKACTDSSATTFCTPLVTACGGGGEGGADASTADGGASQTVFDQNNCEALATALSADGRTALKTCVDEGIAGNCTADPGFCIDQLVNKF